MPRQSESRSAVERDDADALHLPDLEAEHDPAVSHRASMAGLRREVQMRAGSTAATESVHDAAARGVASPTTALPHAAAIQSSFGGAHDVSRIQAHVGGNAADAMGATAFASGNHVVFDQQPDLHTAAHEAAHVVQQAQGVNLYGGVGEAGDAYERHADAVADRVVAGTSAADLLGGPTAHAAPAAGGAIQMDRKKVSDASEKEQSDQHDKAGSLSFDATAKAIALAVVRVHNAATGVDNAIRTMNEGGPGLQAQICKGYFGSVNSEIRRVRTEVEAQGNFGGTHLSPEIKRLNGAYDRFASTWARAQKHLAKYSEDLTDNPDWIRQELASLNATHGLDFKDMSLHDPSVDERKDEVILKESLNATCEAVEETARSVRMGLKTGKDANLAQDLRKMLRHLDELSAQFRQTEKPTPAKLYDKKRLKEAIKEVHALEAEVGAKPALEETIKKSSMWFYLKTIKEQTGVK